MKVRSLILAAVTALPLAGCATHEGGTAQDRLEYGTYRDAGQGNPAPIASPTFNSGMNPDDPRDSHFSSRPRPTQTPPMTAP